VAAKLKTADIKGTIAFINNVWNKYIPAYPLDYKFMDESYGVMYNSEEKLSELLGSSPSWRSLLGVWDCLASPHSVLSKGQKK
jgi:hypothetical protein